jgi:sporulation inhibitor KapD
MKEIVSGRVRSFDEENRIISMYVKDRVKYFYIQRSLLNRVSKYIDYNRFFQFTVTNDEQRIYRNHKVKTVDYIIKIMEIRYRKNIVYYDMKDIQNGTRIMINKIGYKMFLDLEMSMHPYKVDKDFKQEIIQASYYLMDSENKVIEVYDQLIKPTRHTTLTRRTLKFLKITQEQIDEGVDFSEFYHHFKRVVNKYNPAIVVWGRNDFLALEEGYRINDLPDLKSNRYVNLLKLHKNYFNLKNDLGLFNAYGLYEAPLEDQAHNALEDAYVTSKIFYGFKEVLNDQRYVDLSNFK